MAESKVRVEMDDPVEEAALVADFEGGRVTDLGRFGGGYVTVDDGPRRRFEDGRGLAAIVGIDEDHVRDVTEMRLEES